MDLLRVSPRDPKAWKGAIDALYTFLPEGKFVFDDSGVHLSAIDPSQVLYVEMHAPKDYFSEYSLENSPIYVPINLSEYFKVLKRISADDTLHMSLKDTQELYVLLERADGALRREFYLSLIDVPESAVEISRPEGAMHVRVKASVLKDALLDSNIFSESAVLVARPGMLLIEARGQQGQTRTIVRQGPELSVEGNAEATSRYSLAYLQNIMRHADSEGFVDLVFGTDTPLSITYRIGDITLRYFLAHILL